MKRRKSPRPRQDSLFSSEAERTDDNPARQRDESGGSGRSAGRLTADGTDSAPSRPESAERVLEKARQTALRFLSHRMRTGREVRDKLAARGFDGGTVSTVVDRLTEVGLIDDAEYAAAFLRTSLKLRPRSYRVLLSELMKKGVSRETAGAAIRESVELVPEVETARRVMAKAARTYGRLPDGERRRKLFSFLARRGFSPDTISELLGEEEK